MEDWLGAVSGLFVHGGEAGFVSNKDEDDGQNIDCALPNIFGEACDSSELRLNPPCVKDGESGGEGVKCEGGLGSRRLLGGLDALGWLGGLCCFRV